MEISHREKLDSRISALRTTLVERNARIVPKYLEFLSSNALSKLCMSCWFLLDQSTNTSCFDKYDNVMELHSATMSDLEESAAQGCALCVQFIRAPPSCPNKKRKSTDTMINGTVEMKGFLGETNETGYYRPVFLSFGYLTEGGKEDHAYRLYVRLCKISAKELVDHSKYTTTPSGSNTAISMPLWSHWLKKCSWKHAVCRQNMSSRGKFAPTRLVELNGRTQRLVLASDLEVVPNYATLSHCCTSSMYQHLYYLELLTHTNTGWESTFLTLKSSNLDIFREQIPHSALSKTFRDAFLVSWTLGLRYIWIDSLCIIQDSEEDWRKEAATMTDVYRNTFINIAASGAVDGTVGLFFDRDASWRCQIRISIDKQEHLFECIRQTRKMPDFGGNMPLHERGWVLQERILAPRSLLFASTQVLWECGHSKLCESVPARLEYDNSWELQELTSLDKKDWDQDPMSTWSNIVLQYSSCNLTYSQDKLIAISGIARQIQRRSNDQYIAGLWRSSIHRQLCWVTKARVGLIQANDPGYIAPSWSWASVSGTVSLTDSSSFKNGHSNLLEFVAIDITLAGEDPCGAIKNAELIVRYPGLIPGVLKRTPEGWFTTKTMIGIRGHGSEDKIGSKSLEIEIEVDFSETEARKEWLLIKRSSFFP
jgi:hypothetical protein